MRVNIVHITEHAKKRWNSRVSSCDNVHDIIEVVKNSAFIKKDQPLPYGLPRLPNKVYSIKNTVLFIMEAVNIDEYRLITVINDSETRAVSLPKISTKRQKRILAKAKKLLEVKEEKESINGPCVNHKRQIARKKRRKKE